MEVIRDIFDILWGNLYLRFLFILVLTVMAAWIAKIILKQFLKPLAQKTSTKIDDLIIRNLSSMIFYIILAIGLKVSLSYVSLKSFYYSCIVETFLIITVTILILKVVNDLAHHWKKDWAAKTASTADDRLIPLLEKIIKVVVIALAVIFIFDSWNIDISPLLATAGIAGIAVSFAVKDSLANILGGLQLVLDKTFKVGDKVKIESGELGVVLDIGLRSTKLKTYDNEVIYIPNGYLANAKIRNYTVPDLKLRVNVEFGVAYGSDTDKVRSIVLKTLKDMDNVLEKPEPVVQFINMSDFSLDFIARAWVRDYQDAYSMKLQMTDEIYKALNKEGINIPFPTHTVYTKKMD
ncbi:MAG: mechanosensitive ion channel family protein [Candidatus Aminicenantes bacterium]|nr:mechanosensitive ion channel family protein [Candidatus Aminicenantes bacterium]